MARGESFLIGGYVADGEQLSPEFSTGKDVERMWSAVLPVKYVHKVHSSCKLIKVTQDLTLNLCLVCHRCWDEFEPFCQQIDLVI